MSILSGGAINVTNFTNGIWYDFSFQGNIELQVTNTCALNAVIQALCFDNGSTQPTCATPTFSPAAGSYGSAQSVTIGTTTGGATIRYTTDGSTPTETAGTVYSSAVNIAASCTLEAIAYKSGDTDSAVASGTYTISSGNVTYTTDSTTQGSWWSSGGGYVYGSLGYVLCAWNSDSSDVVNLTGSYVQSVTPSGESKAFAWTSTTRSISSTRRPIPAPMGAGMCRDRAITMSTSRW